MRKKAKILLISYLSVLVVTLALYAWAGQWGLGWYRRTANESANLAYEETTRAVDALADALTRSAYATDSDMCDRICCEAYACAAAAESALSTLPFSTWELEQLSAYLNQAGDYAHSLCGQGEPFTDRQREELGELAARAEDFSETLLSLREQLENRALRMDSREQRLRNVGSEPLAPLSGELLSYEADFTPLSLHYDGKYGAEQSSSGGGMLTEQEMQAAAADFASVPVEELQRESAYEGTDSRRCYRAGDCYLCVSRAGVESMARDRVVYEEALSREEARASAEQFLRKHGYGSLALWAEEQRGCVLVLRYVREQDGALCPDAGLSIGVALDDGSIFSFDATAFSRERVQVTWAVEEAEAQAALPEGLRLLESRRLILKSPGGSPVPVYAFSCRDASGRDVEICVRAETGKQYKISVGE